jgi:hypothetical protein
LSFSVLTLKVAVDQLGAASQAIGAQHRQIRFGNEDVAALRRAQHRDRG